MKTKILLSIICACSLFTVQAQEWGYVNTLTDEYMRKIWTQGLDTVYIVGESGLIARSIDQGETWEKQHFPTKVTLNDIIFIDYYTGFAVGEQGTILKTADAGENWSQIPVTTTSQINAIAATGLDNIWAVGDNSLILHSTDIGETWVQENILPETDRELLDIAFRENLGYFTGNYATVYKTEDFGATWNKQTVSEQEFYYMNAHSINIMENKTYVMVDGDLYSTEDQKNWISVFDDNTNRMASNPFFLNDNIGYASLADLSVGSRGNLVILKTVNGGKYWEIIVPNPYYNHIYYNPTQNIHSEPSIIRMVNDMLGYAIFTEVLLKTPAPLYEPPEKIKKIRVNAQLDILQTNSDELVLKSESNPIKSIEIFDILGTKLIHKQWQNPVRETNININNLYKGIYLIRVLFTDKTNETVKWVKH